MRKRSSTELNVPEKANRILNVILVVLLLIGVRIWHLAVIQHEVKLEESKKPQRKVLIEKADRATIRDRFNIPMAINKIQYNAAIIYGQLRQVPRYTWSKDKNGKKIKIPYRKEYIKQLTELLSRELSLDAERLEDLIHSKASILGNVPFTIKEGLTEKEYYRLKALEKDWLGIHTEKVARRFYPLGPVGADVVGYMGAISKAEYDAITFEMRSLRQVIGQWEEGENADVQTRHAIDTAEKRLQELEARAYTINDLVGKAGVEGFFDEKLRGFRGKKTFIADIRGNFLRELPSSQDPVAGERILLTISSELQAYAERLLAEYEEMPIARIGDFNRLGVIPPKQPWIKGGAVVVMDPNDGQLLALASYPRFDPNDFIKDPSRQEDYYKKWNIHRWLENEIYVGAIWDGKIPLERERFSIKEGGFYNEKLFLDWQNYLDFVLPNESNVKKNLLTINSIATLVYLQAKVETLLAYFYEANPLISASKVFDFLYADPHISTGSICSIKEKEKMRDAFFANESKIIALQAELEPFFKNIEQNYEKILLLDISRLIVDPIRFDAELLELVGDQSINNYRLACAKMASLQEGVKKVAEELFHELNFKKWKEEQFKDYLTAKRKEEEDQKRSPKPYIEYMDLVEKELYAQFWEKYRWDLLVYFLTQQKFSLDEEVAPYYGHLQLISNEMSQGAHQQLFFYDAYHQLKNLLADYAPILIYKYLSTLREFKDLKRPLLGWYSGLRSENGLQLEKHLAAAFYPTCGYGYCRSQAFRQSTTIGSVFKLITAYEGLIQRYQKLKHEGKSLRELNPLTIIDDKHRQFNNSNHWNVGYTTEGKSIPMFYHGGRLPRSDHAGIGKVDLIKALEASSNPYFAILAGDIFEDPEDLSQAAELFSYGKRTGIEIPGEIAGSIPKDITYNRTGLYALSIGQHSLIGTPLQTAVMLSAIANGGEVLKPQIVSMTLDENCGVTNKTKKEVKQQVLLPEEVKQLLMKGMHQVVIGEKGTAREVRRFGLQFDDEAPQLYNDICSQVVGKTSTAEALEKLSLDGSYGKLMCKHVWFALISFEQKHLDGIHFEKPELVVIVYLRFGDYGRQAAPLAVHMVKKWREIKSKYAQK